jgi:bifunctional DNA-binding transcriptional regulator/antitoxin component of YhaV-PrlF toxin-antitoxin module
MLGESPSRIVKMPSGASGRPKAHASQSIYRPRYECHTERQLEEPEIAVVGTKGQFVIPQDLRRRLAIKPKTKLAIYRKGDKLVVTKLKIPTAGEELDDFFAEIDEGSKRVASQREIIKEIQAYRKEKRARGN